MKIISNISFISIFSFLFFTGYCFPAEPSFYVSVKGNDTWSGKLAEPSKNGSDGPFATLEKARDTIKELKKGGKLASNGAIVIIKSGVYNLTDTFVLSSEDSGLDGSPVTWSSAPGEKVMITGALHVTNFKSLSDSNIKNRINPEFKKNIWCADLSALGVKDFGQVTELIEGAAPGTELFSGGKRMTLARWPNEGWTKIIDVPQDSFPVYEGTKPHVRDGIFVGRHFGKFVYEGDNPGKWENEGNIFLHGFWAWDWLDTFINVDKIDSSKSEIYPAKPYHRYGYSKGQRYYAFNIPEELDMPGEWYLDRKTGILYFWLPEKSSLKDTYLSVLDSPLISLENAENIVIKGIEFGYSKNAGVKVTGGKNNIIGGCVFHCLGREGVIIESGINNGVTGCDIFDMSSGGIIIKGGDRKTLTPAGNYARNNDIHNYSNWTKTYMAAIRLEGVGNILANNHIHDAPHTGIVPFGNDHVIEYNELDDLALETGDVGAIRFDGIVTERGNIVRYNYFHDIIAKSEEAVVGVYMDDFTCGVTVYGNVFYRSSKAAYIGGGRDNVIENNLFVECFPSVHLDSRGLSWAKINITYRFPEMYDKKYNEPPYSVRYPALLKYFNDNPAVPIDNKVLNNVSYGGWWLELDDMLEPSILEMKSNVVADSILVKMRFNPDYKNDPDKKIIGETFYKSGDKRIESIFKNDVFTNANPGIIISGGKITGIKQDSMAVSHGFKTIPFDKIGLFKDEFRKEIKN